MDYTVVCNNCGKVGKMRSPISEDADLIDKLCYRLPTFIFCQDCIAKIIVKEETKYEQYSE